MGDEPRTLIVTGASSGIGRALALAASREGYRVVIVARRSARLDEVARTIRDASGACVALAGDVTARDLPSRIVDTALHSFGRIDVLVNNAGAGAYGALLEQTDAEIEAQWQLNVAAPLRIARAALPHLTTTRGQLVFIGSGVARIPLPRHGAYAVSKAAIRAAATQLRRELGSRGIAVTYVDPGVVATEFHSSLNIERPPGWIAPAQSAARAILRGIRRRRAVINAVPWQTAFATLGEWSGTLADRVVTRLYTVRRVAPAASEAPSVACRPEPVEGLEEKAPFEKALEPVARRMERVKLPPNFLREALAPGATLELGALAMRWAGMPNKNERAVLREALNALSAGGFLEPTEEDTWRVIRAAR
jgi:short-subunit dehydrogenase